MQGMVVRSLSSFDVDESKTAVEGGDPDNGEDPIIIPSLYYVRQLDDRWHAGISLTVPTGFGADYGSEWPPVSARTTAASGQGVTRLLIFHWSIFP
jgi:long-chain fatty acid transport protein